MKKVLATLLAVTSIAIYPTSVFATEAEPPSYTKSAVVSEYEPSAELNQTPIFLRRYAVIRNFYTNGSIKNKTVTVSTTVNLYSKYKSKIVIKLERSTNGTNWTKVCTLLNSTKAASDYIVKASKTNLSSSYQYRIVSTLTVYGSDGEIIESDSHNWKFTV